MGAIQVASSKSGFLTTCIYWIYEIPSQICKKTLIKVYIIFVLTENEEAIYYLYVAGKVVHWSYAYEYNEKC